MITSRDVVLTQVDHSGIAVHITAVICHVEGVVGETATEPVGLCIEYDEVAQAADLPWDGPCGMAWTDNISPLFETFSTSHSAVGWPAASLGCESWPLTRSNSDGSVPQAHVGTPHHSTN